MNLLQEEFLSFIPVYGRFIGFYLAFFTLSFGIISCLTWLPSKNFALSWWTPRFAKHGLILLVFLLICIQLIFLWSIRLSMRFNTGDAAFVNQVLYTASHGELFSQTIYYAANGYWTQPSAYYFGSSHLVSPMYTPLLMFGWMYRLFPASPMHVLIAYFVVYILGGGALFYTALQLTKRFWIAAVSVLCLFLLPQLASVVFHLGHFDVYSFPFVVMTLYFLLRDKPIGYGIFLALSAGVSLPTQFTCWAIAFVAVIKYRRWSYVGLALALAAWSIASFETYNLVRFCMTSLQGASPVSKITQTVFPDILQTGTWVLRHGLYVVSIGVMVFSALWFNMKWVRQYWWLIAISLPSLGVAAARGAAVVNHHNINALAVFLFTLPLALNQVWETANFKRRQIIAKIAIAQLMGLLLLSLTSRQLPMSSFFTLEPYEFNESELTTMVQKVNTLVPKTASLCYWVNPHSQGLIANRSRIWPINTAPATRSPNCEYYLIQEKAKTHYPEEQLTEALGPVQAHLQIVDAWEGWKIYRTTNPEQLKYPYWVMGFNFVHNLFRTSCPTPVLLGLSPENRQNVAD